MIKRVSFKNGLGMKMRGYLHIPKKDNGKAIVFCHGFPSNSKGSTSPRIGKSFEKLGYTVLRFDFSHNLDSEGKFEDKLMSKEVEDIKYAINFLEKVVDFKELILIGHSTGAIDASLYAHKDKRINNLVLSGPVSDLKHAARYDFTDEQIKDFWTKGYIVYNRSGSFVNGKKLKKAFYDEFFKLDIPSSMKKYKGKVLIIHGKNDQAIPSSKDPIELYKLCNKPKKLVIVKGADHSFTGKKEWRKFVSEVNRFIQS